MPNLSVYDLDTLVIIPGEYFTPYITLTGKCQRLLQSGCIRQTLGKQTTIQRQCKGIIYCQIFNYSATYLEWHRNLDLFDKKYQSSYHTRQWDMITLMILPTGLLMNFQRKVQSLRLTNLFTVLILVLIMMCLFMGQVDTEESRSRWYKTESSQSASPFLTEPVNDKHLNYFGANYTEYRSLGFLWYR